MDFVVVGIFIGAIIVGAGAVVRDLAPRRQPRISRSDSESIKPETLTRSWRRFCQSAGLVLITMGMIIVFATVVGIVFSLSDSSGWMLVGGSSALAAGVIGVSAIIIPNHYRRGGFDPVIRARPVARAPAFRRAVVERDVEYPLGRPPVDTPDDPFAIEPSTAVLIPPPAASAARERPVVAIDDDGVTDAPVLNLAETEVESAGRANTVEAPPSERNSTRERVRSQRRPKPEPESDLAVTYNRPDINGPDLTARPVDRPPRPAEPITPTFAALEEPLIDPGEELPAWDAPPPPTLEPARYAPLPQRPAETDRSGAGFESSLFADLDASSESAAAGAGPFQSRLLNELTSGDTRPVKPVADVLLDEFSLPDRDRSNTRNADDNR